MQKITNSLHFLQTNPNKIYLLDGNGETLFTSKHKEVELREGDDHPNFIDAFNAYTPPATGNFVLRNYYFKERI